MMPNLYIVGSGGLGRGLADALIYDNHAHINQEFKNIYFVDDKSKGLYINEIEVKFSIEDLVNFREESLVINAIGEPKMREKIQTKLSSNKMLKFPNYIDCGVKIYRNNIIGEGNIITKGVVLSTNIVIGNFNLVHFNTTIGHDVKMKDFNCIYPLVSLSGYTTIGNGNMIGTNSSSLPASTMKDYIRVGANSLIKGNYESNITILGSPAIDIREQEED